MGQICASFEAALKNMKIVNKFKDIENFISKLSKLNTHKNIEDSKIGNLNTCEKYKTFVFCGLFCVHFLLACKFIKKNDDFIVKRIITYLRICQIV